jgi:hypothetical protein
LNKGRKFGIIGGIIGVTILVLVFANSDEDFTQVDEFSGEPKISILDSSQKINTECDLVNFLNEDDNLILVQSFLQSNEEQFQERFEELGGGQTDPPDSQSVVKDGEIAKIVFAEMIIKEFSINPDLKEFVIISAEDSSQELVERVKTNDPDCQINDGKLNPKSPSIESPVGAGQIGNEHSHAAILVKIFGDRFDFSAPAYQIKASWIHFEAGDGSTIHNHATGVTLGYLFETLGLGVTDQCFVFQDGRSFCTNEDYSLKFFVNGDQVDDISQYETSDGDRILISYGAETTQEIEKQLMELDNQQIIV